MLFNTLARERFEDTWRRTFSYKQLQGKQQGDYRGHLCPSCLRGCRLVLPLGLANTLSASLNTKPPFLLSAHVLNSAHTRAHTLRHSDGLATYPTQTNCSLNQSVQHTRPEPGQMKRCHAFCRAQEGLKSVLFF